MLRKGLGADLERFAALVASRPAPLHVHDRA
jgi:hypothetical protein